MRGRASGRRGAAAAARPRRERRRRAAAGRPPAGARRQLWQEEAEEEGAGFSLVASAAEGGGLLHRGRLAARGAGRAGEGASHGAGGAAGGARRGGGAGRRACGGARRARGHEAARKAWRGRWRRRRGGQAKLAVVSGEACSAAAGGTAPIRHRPQPPLRTRSVRARAAARAQAPGGPGVARRLSNLTLRGVNAPARRGRPRRGQAPRCGPRSDGQAQAALRGRSQSGRQPAGVRPRRRRRPRRSGRGARRRRGCGGGRQGGAPAADRRAAG